MEIILKVISLRGKNEACHSASFKAKVVLEAIREQRTINEIASSYGIHPNLLSQWKKQALDSLPEIFKNGRAKAQKNEEALRDRLYLQIGQLQVELDWLKKKTGFSN